MNRQRITLIILIVVGGSAVLGSYVHGILANPDTRGDVWGGVPDSLRPVYTVNMLLAAAGFFPFTAFLLLRFREAGERFGFGLINGLYAAILVGSALWMPLTFAMLESPSTGLWWSILIVLWVVGLASLGVLGALLTVRNGAGTWLHRAAVVGAVFFCLQTALLDALIWPYFFPVG